MAVWIIKKRGADEWCQWIDAGHGPRVTWVSSQLQASTCEAADGGAPGQSWLDAMFMGVAVDVERVFQA